MWSKFLLGGGENLSKPLREEETTAVVAASAAEDGEIVDDEHDEVGEEEEEVDDVQVRQHPVHQSVNQSTDDSIDDGPGGGLLGNRFSYVGRLATRFIGQVTTTTTGDQEDEADFLLDDNEDAGWNEDEEVLDNLTEEHSDDDRITAPLKDSWTAEPHTEESFQTANASFEESNDNIVQKAGNGSGVADGNEPANDEKANVWDDENEDLEFSASEHYEAATTVPSPGAALEPDPTVEETGLETSEREVAGKLDTVLQQIDEQEQLQSPDGSRVSDDDDGITSSDEEHRNEAVHQIQQELEQVEWMATAVPRVRVVDHTPRPEDKSGTESSQLQTQASLVTLFASEDLTRDTGAVATAGDADQVDDGGGDDEDLYDNDNELEYGRIVDHTPTKPALLERNDSLAVQAQQLDADIKEDAAMSVTDSGRDETDLNNSEVDDIGQIDNAAKVHVETNVVDHTPAVDDDAENGPSTALSVDCQASMGDTVDVVPDDGKEMDEAHEFGHIVDVTPPTPAPESSISASGTNASLALNASEIEDDFANDEAMDDSGCDEERRNQSVNQLDGETLTSPQVVDHTPSHDEIVTKSQQLSLASLAASDDLTRDTGAVAAAGDAGHSLVADEDVYDNENELEYGPIVDHTPTKPVPFKRNDSMAVQVGQLGSDLRDEAAMSVSDGSESISDAGSNSQKNKQNGQEMLVEPNLVDHTPTEDHDQKKRDSSFSVDVLASLGDTVDVVPDDGKEMDEINVFGPVVDLTPPTPATGSSVSVSGTNVSLVVNARDIEEDFAEDEAMDDTCYGDSTVGGILTDGAEGDTDGSRGDGWDVDDDEDDVALANVDGDNGDIPHPASMEPKRATFSITLTTTQSHVVDHIPSELPESASVVKNRNRDPSMVALATSEDETRDTGLGIDEDVYDDENEQEYGPVVDHTPQTPASCYVSSGANSLAVHASALKEDIEDDEAMDDTSYNGSTLGDGETDADEGGGWGEEDPQCDNEEGRKQQARVLSVGTSVGDVALVDHTPSEMGSPSKSIHGGPSVDVLASVANTVETGDADSTGEVNVVYGPVVDQTPTTPAPSMLGRSDSVLVQRNDDVDSVDETTVVGGSRIEYGDDTADEDIPSGPDSQGNENQVVDYVPPLRPESRYGDGSTLVAADPSEVMSEVDDMAPEEQNFGPVVDLTPPAHASSADSGLPSGEGSTVVFVPPSVAADDLDPDDDAGADQEGWDTGDAAVLAEPNPQSGNDEHAIPNRVSEQLVDFLPPPDDDIGEVDDAVRGEALSEITVGGAQSLLQGVDPVEDDYGPVVDQIPSVAEESLRSHASTSTQLTASECRAMEKDDRVNGGDDASSVEAKAKVVVDHLPRMEGKRPIDSTATLGRSQLSDEEEEEEEEDTSKFGPVVDHLPTSRASLAPSRGGSTVDALATVSEVHSDDEEGDTWDDDADFDASLGGASESTGRHAVSGVAARQLSQQSGTTPNIETDRNISVRFDSSVNDTRSDTALTSHNKMRHFDPDIGTAVPDEAQYYDPEQLSISETQYFDPEQGHGNVWSDALVTSESSSLARDARRNEMTYKSFAEADTPPSTPYRRPESGILVESKEDGPDILLPRLSSFKCEKCASSQTADCPCVQRLLAINSENGTVVGSMITPDGDTIKIDFNQLLQDEVTRRRLVEEELAALKLSMGPRKLNESLIKLRESELETKISELGQTKVELLKRVLVAENMSEMLRGDNCKLNDELLSSRNSVAELQNSQASFVAKEAFFHAENVALKKSLGDSVSEEPAGEDARNTLLSLQVELAQKTGECNELKTKVAQLDQRLHESDKAFAVQAKESAELSILLKQSTTSLKEQLIGSDALIKTTEDARFELERKIQSLNFEVNNLRSSSKLVADIQVQHENDLQQQYKLLDIKTAELRTLEELLTALQVEKKSILADLVQQRALAEQSEILANELISVAQERDLLERALHESRDAMISLQNLMNEHGMEGQALNLKREQENSTLKSDLEEIRCSLTFKEKELSELVSQIEALAMDKSELEVQLCDSKQAHRAAELVAEAAELSAENEKIKTAQREKEIEVMKKDLDEISKDHDMLAREVQETTAHLDEIGKVLKCVEGEAKDHLSRNTALENELSRLKALSNVLTEERDTSASERDEAVTRCEEMETKYASALTEFEQKVKQLTKAYEEDLTQLKEGSDLLREEVARLQEAKQYHAQALEEVERNFQDEARHYEESTARLRLECGELRQEIAYLEDRESKQARTLAELKVEIQEQPDNANHLEHVDALRKEVACYQESQRIAALELEELQQKMEEQSKLHTEDATQLMEQCDQLRSELTRYHALETEHTRVMADLERRSVETIHAYDIKIARLQTECDERRVQSEKDKAVAEELGLERDRLGEVMRECDILSEENEEMLVQFGLLKQQMDEAHNNVRALQAEIDVMHMSPQNGAPSAELEDIRAKNAELDARIESVLKERDALSDRAESLGCSSKQEIEGLKSQIQRLESQTSDLGKKCEERQDEIDRLRGLQQKLDDWTAEMRQKDERLASYENEIQSLKVKIESVYDSSDAKSRKIEALRKKSKETEKELSKHVHELDERAKNMEEQLHLSTEKVKVTEAALAARGQILLLLKESELQIQELESALTERNAEVTQLHRSAHDLEQQHNVAGPAAIEMSALQQQIDVLSEALQSTRNRLATKEQDIDRLSGEIRTLQSAQTQQAMSTLATASKESTAEATKLRDSLVSRAALLKRSDSNRAEAIHRLEAERKANAETLRRLSESVKKYYSSS